MVQQRSIILGGNEISSSNPMSTSVTGITMPTAVVDGQTTVTTAGTAVALGQFDHALVWRHDQGAHREYR